ncbi:MAG: FHIPEP family type III secretion protein [Candidatus Eremiobacterota bacterium]
MNNKKENDFDPVMCYLSLVPDGPVLEEKKEEKKKTEDELRNLMKVDTMCIEIGTDLIPLVDPGTGAKLLDRVTSIRRHIALEMGFILPPVRFRDNKNLKSQSYIIKIRDNVIAEGCVIINKFLAIAPGKSLDTLEGLRVWDPTFGMPSVWISAGQRGEAEKLGAMIFDPVSVIATQVTDTIRRYAFEMLDYEIVFKILEEVRKNSPLLAEEIYPKSFTCQEIYEILYNLLRERISIRDMVTIMESMAHYASVEIDTDRLTEYVRQSLCHVICREYKDSENTIYAITIEERLTGILASFIKKDHDRKFKLDSLLKEFILNALNEHINTMKDGRLISVILCHPQIRLFLRKVTENFFPDLPVLSYNEIAPGIKVVSAATLSLPDEMADRYNNKENLIVSYIEKFQNDSHPSMRCTAIKMIDSIADKYDLDKLLTYLDRGLLDQVQNVRLEAAGAIKKLFGTPVTETEVLEKQKKKKDLCESGKSLLNPSDRGDGEALREVNTDYPPGFSIEIDLIAIDLGRGLLSLVDPNQGEALIERIWSIRREIIADKGCGMPAIRYRDNLQLKPNGYMIKIKDIEVAKGEVIINKLLAAGTEEQIKSLKGQGSVDPDYGKPSVWITRDQREEAEKLGCKIFDPVSVIAIHVKKIADKYAFELIDYNKVSYLMEELKRNNPLSAGEIYPEILGITEIHRILKNLLKEKVSIKDMALIMRTLKKYVLITRDIDLLTEYVRQSLCRFICSPLQDDERSINVVTIGEELERILAGSIKENKKISSLVISGETGGFILSSIKEHLDAFNERNLPPVILCSSRIRLAFRRFIERPFPEFSVLSYEEIPPEITVNKRSVINLPPDILERYRNKDKLIFSYIEKFQKDSEPSIRTMAVEMILSLARLYDGETLLPYLDAGLKDEDQSVRSEAAGAVKELLDQ